MLREPAEGLRKMQSLRLLDLYKKAWESGNVITCLRVMEREARLHGLDAPDKHEIAIPQRSIPELAEETAESLRQLGATVIPPPDGWPNKVPEAQ